jgi:predicted nucleic acid-binding protein
VSQVARGPVVIDTGVFGAPLTRRTWPLGESYRPLVEGRAALVSFVTAAELRFGARLGGWGTQRLRLLDRELERAETIWPGLELLDAYVALRCWCVRAGHALGQKHHEADRWVAATAMWLAVPLVAHDAIFAGVEGLNLLTKLDL